MAIELMSDSIGQLIMNTSIFGGGLLLGILSLVFGIARGMTKNSEMWALIFASFAWLVALIAPNTVFASGVFFAGAVAITMAFTPIIKEVPESNIFLMALLAIVVDCMLVIGSGAFTMSLDWGTNLDAAREDIASSIGTKVTIIEGYTPDTGLVTPEQEAAGMGNNIFLNTFNALTFDTVASVLAITEYVGKALKFAGMALMAPFVMTAVLASEGNGVNPFIAVMIGLYITMWNLAILYNGIRFILTKSRL